MSGNFQSKKNESQTRHRVFVASKSDIKIDAARGVFENIEIIPVDSQSNIPEQPMGYDQTLQGAHNRIATSKNNGALGKIIAIENGLIQGMELIARQIDEDVLGEPVEKNSWYDVVIVVIDDDKRHEAICLSKGVKVPQYLIDQVLTVGDQLITMGKILAKEHPEINPQDPHIFLTEGKVGRGQLMRDTIKMADQNLVKEKL